MNIEGIEYVLTKKEKKEFFEEEKDSFVNENGELYLTKTEFVNSDAVYLINLKDETAELLCKDMVIFCDFLSVEKFINEKMKKRIKIIY